MEQGEEQEKGISDVARDLSRDREVAANKQKGFNLAIDDGMNFDRSTLKDTDRTERGNVLSMM